MLEPIPSGKPTHDNSCGAGWEKISRNSLSWRSRIPRLDAWWMQIGINLITLRKTALTLQTENSGACAVGASRCKYVLDFGELM